MSAAVAGQLYELTHLNLAQVPLRYTAVCIILGVPVVSECPVRDILPLALALKPAIMHVSGFHPGQFRGHFRGCIIRFCCANSANPYLHSKIYFVTAYKSCGLHSRVETNWPSILGSRLRSLLKYCSLTQVVVSPPMPANKNLLQYSLPLTDTHLWGNVTLPVPQLVLKGREVTRATCNTECCRADCKKCSCNILCPFCVKFRLSHKY